VDAIIVSAAKETNGQNTRYANASRRHGHEPKITRAFAIGSSDPAGVVARFQAAAEKSTDLRIRSASRQDDTYLQFHHDLIWGKDDDEIATLIKEADIVHLNNSDRAARRFRIHKPMLMHHHGTLFRSNPSHFVQVAQIRRMLAAVSTIDLLRLGPEGSLHWLPTAYPISDLLAFGKKYRRPEDGRILIAHAPTNQAFKGTAVFLEAVKQLQWDGLPIDVDLIEGVSNAECMERKARADILFDQLAWGYGCNAVEAWGMGIPVISGSDEWTDQRMRQEFGGDVPYALASEKTLRDVIEQMVTSKQARDDYAAKGLAHVKRFHDERPALARLAELYADCIRHFVGRTPTNYKPAKFTAPVGYTFRPWVGGPKIVFENGTYETTHPDEATRLRYLAKRLPLGISEVA
jgi:hypothetical protein